MKRLLDRATLLIMTSAFMVAVLCILPASRNMFPFWIIAMGMNIADTLFHELGHTLFNWLLGYPAIPMIFTLFGADQAGGMTLTFGRSWFVQIAAFAAMGYGCYWTKENIPRLFIPLVIFTLAMILTAFYRHHEALVCYMGHGSSIAIGGFFLFRAWVYLDSRNAFERWLNAFFGFFLTLYNCYFAYSLAFNSVTRENYSDHAAFGITHNDFQLMSDEIYFLSVKGISVFTMGYCIVIIIGSFILAAFLNNEFEG